MIVARIYKSGKTDKMKGSSQIFNYDGAKDGWFPANSFSFGFDAKQQDSEANGSQPRSQSRSTAGSGSGAGQNTTAPKASDKDKNQVFSAISISKEVDSTTCDLMKLAMEERKSKKGVDSGIHADIHVLSSVDVHMQKRFIFAAVMVHLEGVRVEQWNIDSSGDERPSETVQIKYDRAAICYQRTPDGKNFSPIHESGWDQTNNVAWRYKDFQDYIVTPTLSS